MPKAAGHGYNNTRAQWSSGNLQWIDGSGNVIATVDGTNRKLTIPSGSKLDVSALSQGKGWIDLKLADARVITSNDFAAIAVGGAGTFGSAGILGVDGSTAPALKRVNAATDIAASIQWAAGVATELQWQTFLPPDLDVAQPVVINARAYMGGAMDTPTLTFKAFADKGGTDAGGATGALAATTSTVTKSIAGATFSANSVPLSITVVPGTHANDAVILIGLWITYTKLTS